MKQIFVLIGVFNLVLMGCGSAQEKADKVDNLVIGKDTKRYVKATVDTSAPDYPDPSDVLQAYIKSYADTLKIDTSFDDDGQLLSIRFRHFCMFDSALDLPEKYLRPYRLKGFITHNFKSTLRLSLGGTILLDTTITKEMFTNKIYEEEKLYGTMFYSGNTVFSKESMDIHYSISIPLTDVGLFASLRCRYDGKLIPTVEGGKK